MLPIKTGMATVVPDTRYVQVEGSLDPTETYLTLQIPIGPTTHEMGLSIRGASEGDGSPPPMIGPMSLVDRNGDRSRTSARSGATEGRPMR